MNHVDTVRPGPRPPGCLPLPLLAGVALSPFDTAGCATRHQRRFLQPPCQSATLSPASVPAAATAASTARAIIACAVASLPPPPSATLRRWRIGTTEGDAASPPRWRDPGLLRCSPPRAGWQLRRQRHPPGKNSTGVIASGRGCHHLPVQHLRGRRDEPPTVSPASVSNNFVLQLCVSYMSY